MEQWRHSGLRGGAGAAGLGVAQNRSSGARRRRRELAWGTTIRVGPWERRSGGERGPQCAPSKYGSVGVGHRSGGRRQQAGRAARELRERGPRGALLISEITLEIVRARSQSQWKTARQGLQIVRPTACVSSTSRCPCGFRRSAADESRRAALPVLGAGQSACNGAEGHPRRWSTPTVTGGRARQGCGRCPQSARQRDCCGVDGGGQDRVRV